MFDNFINGVNSLINKILGSGVATNITNEYTDIIKYYFSNSDNDVSGNYSFKENIYGKVIPVVIGQSRIDGKIIWSTQVNKKVAKQGSTVFSNISQNNLYTISFAVSVCEGPITKINNIFIANKVLDVAKYNIHYYLGGENQMPDPLIESIVGKGNCPAFRDHAYVVFEDFPLQDFNSILPVFSFEVVNKINYQHKTLGDKIKSLVVIPGSGEYVYDTNIVYKYNKLSNGNILDSERLNAHSNKKIANSVENLSQLSLICQNVKWISVTCCWFVTSLNISETDLLPGVESDNDSLYSSIWKVGIYDRKSAYKIMKDNNNILRYGGTPDDSSLVSYINLLKSQGYKILFYPLIFVDTDTKDWRGHITGLPEEVNNFFNKDKGYNDFILHYTKLLQELVDGFVIGSELKGLTTIRDSSDSFPAVNQIVDLATQVKRILGNSVIVTYAADWSEYHHANDGWYHLDSLWSSNDIDVIGIDMYFPLTNTKSSFISDIEILKGFTSGEGYDYYHNGNKKIPLKPEFAWKNIDYWWNNIHINPNGNQTSWIPKSKKIWFTEFGFPSIDKCTNEPNKFFDPSSRDGGFPLYSNGFSNFQLQHQAINIAIDYFESLDYLDNYFLWCWDIRPSPIWPFTKYWHDHYLWSRGHWINNKILLTNISSIIEFLCFRANINIDNIKFEFSDTMLDGIILSEDIKIIDVINILRISYLFDIDASQGNIIRFVNRNNNDKLSDINYSDCITPKGSLLNEETFSSPSDYSFRFTFYNRLENYKRNDIYNSTSNNHQQILYINIFFPFALSIFEAEYILNKILSHSVAENKKINFYLPYLHKDLKLCEVYNYNNLSSISKQKIVSIKNYDHHIIEYNSLLATNLVSPLINYDDYEYSNNIIINKKELCVVHELPYIPHINTNLCLYYSYNQGKENILVYNIKGQEEYIAKELHNNSIIAVLNNINYNQALVTPDLIDYNTKLQFFSYDKLDEHNQEEFYTAKSLCMLGSEIISYRDVKKINTNIYEISTLMRGMYGTEQYINSHEVGELLVLLSSSQKVDLNQSYIGKLLYFRVNNISSEFLYQGFKLKLSSVSNIKHFKEKNFVILEWDYDYSYFYDWFESIFLNIKYKIILRDGKLEYNFESLVPRIRLDLSILNLSATFILSIIVNDTDYNLSSDSVDIKINLLE